MKNQVNKLSSLLEQNNISLPQGENKSDVGQPIEDHDWYYSLKEGLTQSNYYLIDYVASNHMDSSEESFTTLDLSGGPSIYMGDNSQIPIVGKGSIKILHGNFINLLYVPSLETNFLSVYQMTHTR